MPYHTLVDSSTRATLAASSNIAGIVFLNEHMPDTAYLTYVSWPHYQKSLFLTKYSADRLPEWMLDQKTRIFVKTRRDLVTNELRVRAVLASAKLDTIDNIMRNLNIARYKVRTGVELQETVYMTKKMQAQAFKDSGCDEARIMEFPYVLQYADFAGITFRQAADAVLLKAKFDDDILAKTELLRLRYFNKIRSASKPEEMTPIYEEFMRDCFTNARV